MARRTLQRRFWLVRIVAVAFVASLTILAVSTAGRVAAEAARARITQNAIETLNVQVAVLRGLLDKYRLLPPLLSQTREVLLTLSPAGAPLIEIDRSSAKRMVGQITAMSGALDVVLLAPDGKIVASARDILPADRGMFEQTLRTAREGRLGRQGFVLANGEPAYLFVSSVRRQQTNVGYLAVLVGFANVEQTWSLSENLIYVTDQNDLVFLTNRSKEETARLSRSLTENAFPADAIAVTRDLPVLDWTVHVLADTRSIASARDTARLVAGLSALVVVFGAAFVIFRREQALLRERREQATALKLERIVRDRTHDLSHANRSLRGEVEERRQAETRLRQAQNELVHTAKLAGLGQMAAALGHEFNQPIAAIRTYADNADRLLAHGNAQTASHNLQRISAMTERMAELSKTLLAFARKPETSVRPVSLGPVLDEAMVLVRPRLAKAGVALTIDPSLRSLEVYGGKIRLSQVFINLINNAADAMVDKDGGTIEIAPVVTQRGDVFEIAITDDGPGIPSELHEEIFEPFVTTKASGEGIGIGLSIVSNILADFGGTLRLAKSDCEGTSFVVGLKQTTREAIAAE